jgi:DOPA 4,5-dioxygenase
MTDSAFADEAPYHGHVYYEPHEREVAEASRTRFSRLSGADGDPNIMFVGRMTEGPAGPHPIPQYEIHFRKRSLEGVLALIRSAKLRALVHPLTDDDLADHTSLAIWIGEPIELDLSTLDPPGMNQGVPRFGTTDF